MTSVVKLILRFVFSWCFRTVVLLLLLLPVCFSSCVVSFLLFSRLKLVVVLLVLFRFLFMLFLVDIQ